jgi:hypothetical protein
MCAIDALGIAAMFSLPIEVGRAIFGDVFHEEVPNADRNRSR